MRAIAAANGIVYIGGNFQNRYHPVSSTVLRISEQYRVLVAGICRQQRRNQCMVGKPVFPACRGSVNDGGVEWSVSACFRTRYPLPGVPMLIAPAYGFVATSDTLRLLWKKCGPYVSRYRIEIATDSAMLTHLIDSVVTDTEVVRYAFNDRLTVWWRISACNESGWSESSEIRRFSTSCPPVLPRHFSLDKVFSSHSRIIVTSRVAEERTVRMEMIALGGKSISTLLHEKRSAGFCHDVFPVGKLSVGTYLLSLKADRFFRVFRFSITQ